MLTFEQLKIQQPQVTNILVNELQQQSLSHAYLFSGQQLSQQLECAKLLIKSLACLAPNGVEPCLQCLNCKKIEDNNYRDLYIVQTEQLMLKKTDTINLQRFMMAAPVEGKYKFYIILEADKMNMQAANSLLKSIEEPTGQSLGILISNSPQKILPTILSRCQQIKFLSHSLQNIQQLSQQYTHLEPLYIQMAMLLSVNSEDAHLLLQQENFIKQINMIQSWSEKLLFDPLCILSVIDILPEFKGKKEQLFMYRILLNYYQNMLYCKLNKQPLLDYEITFDLTQVSLSKIIKAIEKILMALTNIERNVNSQLVMEQLIIEIQGDK